MLLEGIKKDVDIHISQCIKCRQQNLHPQYYAEVHLELLSMPMHLIVIKLIGKFKLSPQGYQYALTVIDMMMNYKWCIPLFTKKKMMKWGMPT